MTVRRPSGADATPPDFMRAQNGIARGPRRDPADIPVPEEPTMRIAVPAETAEEPRVAATPETVKKLIALGGTVAVQSGAGRSSGLTDEAFRAAGASVEPDAAATLKDADVVLKVRRPEAADLPERLIA